MGILTKLDPMRTTLLLFFKLVTSCYKSSNELESSGAIQLHDYVDNFDQQWTVTSACKEAHIISTNFDTEQCCDHVTIEGTRYNGVDVVDQVVGANFTVTFSSDYSITRSGFDLQWSCVIPETTTTSTTTTTTTITPVQTSTPENKNVDYPDYKNTFKKTDACFNLNDETGMVEYTGTMMTAHNGTMCTMWNETRYPEAEKNYCRAPDHDTDGVWCYCNECENGWDYCDVPDCQGPQFTECVPGSSGYTGTVNHTMSGVPCQTWSNNYPNTVNVYPSFDRHHTNYCSEAGGLSRAWCYKGLYYDADESWEYCDINYNCHDNDDYDNAVEYNYN